MSDDDRDDDYEPEEEEEVELSDDESGYNTGATTGTDDDGSDIFDEEVDPITLLDSMMQLQPGEAGHLQPFEMLRQHQHRSSGHQVGAPRPDALRK